MIENLDELRKIAERVNRGVAWEAQMEPGDKKTAPHAYVEIGPHEVILPWLNGSYLTAQHIATFAPPTVLALLLRLEQAEARVKLLESGIVSELVVSSVHSAQAFGVAVYGIADELLKMGYAGLSERLEQAEDSARLVDGMLRAVLEAFGSGPETDPIIKARQIVARLEQAEQFVTIRESELLELKGKCSNPECRLHRAHSGPCDCLALNGDTRG